MNQQSPFPKPQHLAAPIRELALKIEGSPLEPALGEFTRELTAAGITRLKPDFYLSTEWGVPFPSISIGIPFWLAQPELTQLHAERAGYVEGAGRADLLRFLRHEMGHVVSYAYELYEREEWTKLFGSMTQPYVEDYTPQPFSRRHVRHLPGWYAQMHPDEDWAETFAVWLTPGSNWRAAYRDWPAALAKLDYCERIMAEVSARDPVVTKIDHDEAASEMKSSVEEFYRKAKSWEGDPWPPGLDGALTAIFQDHREGGGGSLRPAEELIGSVERELAANVYRWTGHFPEATRLLVRHLQERARALHQVYAVEHKDEATIAFTALVTALAMNHVLKGSYIP